jgi:molybdate transport repressor ModE-like protein
VLILPKFTLTKPAFKVWLETDEGYVFGPGVYRLLGRVRDEGTIKAAAESLGMSYRFAWGLVRKAEKKIGQPLMITHKGGRDGGGGTELTEVGLDFLADYSKMERLIEELSSDPTLLQGPISRTRVKARITDVEVDGEMTGISLSINTPIKLETRVPATMIKDQLKNGDEVEIELIAFIGLKD